ncbi:hypothetical protein BHM03_00053071 [Ensete ventricosum]|nr:hypothetical protein BHM03_00053071 [Ensete ventricosum]
MVCVSLRPMEVVESTTELREDDVTDEVTRGSLPLDSPSLELFNLPDLRRDIEDIEQSLFSEVGHLLEAAEEMTNEFLKSLGDPARRQGDSAPSGGGRIPSDRQSKEDPAKPTIFILLTTLVSGRYRKLNLPPGPGPWPVIGNLNLIGPLPYYSLAALSQKHDPLMHLRFGSLPVVVGSSVDMAKFFLKTHDLSFVSPPKIAIGTRICTMELFTPKRLDSYQYVRVEEVRCLLQNLIRLLE